MKYVITGVSRLSGEREAISGPCAKWKAQQLCLRHSSIPSKRRVYTRLKVEPAVREGRLW